MRSWTESQGGFKLASAVSPHNKLIDLHTHSTASDGTLLPAQLVEEAVAAGISVLALTDHDSVAGLDEARVETEKLGIVLVAGIELSVTWAGRTLHLLGLGIDDQNPALHSALDDALDFRQWRAREIARKLEEKGVQNALAGAQCYAGSQLISRTHFARHLVNEGHARDVRQVFKRFMVRGKPGHVRGQWLSLEHGVELIHQAGGIAVLAHPARYSLSRSKFRGLLEELKGLGADGLEVVSGSHSREENQIIAQHALDFEFPASQGSDYHGPDKPWIKLGCLPPLYYRCTPVWEAGLNIEGVSL